jgi:hypothetical protein
VIESSDDAEDDENTSNYEDDEGQALTNEEIKHKIANHFPINSNAILHYEQRLSDSNSYINLENQEDWSEQLSKDTSQHVREIVAIDFFQIDFHKAISK